MSNDLSWRVLGRVCDDTNDGLLPHPARSSEIAWRSASGPKPDAADFDVGFCFAPKADLQDGRVQGPHTTPIGDP